MAGRDPPSVRTVLELLEACPPLTGAQLRAASGLPRRTVYQALRVLCERGTVLHRTSLRDSRQTYYWLNQTPSSEADSPTRQTPRARVAHPALA